MFCHGLLLTAAAALPLAPLSPWPSVSVQMVTYNRGPLLLEAIEQVGYQDYQGSLEVVIIDDSPKSMAEELDKAIVQSPRALALRYVYLEERMSIGAKRNLATRSTSAEVICIWDDDDVFTMDRIRKQVQHLQGGVNCSAIEVASFYSVPDQELSVRPIGLEPIAFENTLCFSRDWWESGNFGFGESWEVSGQGEGTLEPWWSQVDPLSGAEEPFLYIYLPSSASGGTALNKNRSPPPSAALAALSKALHPSSARFPEKHRGAHVSKALAAARSEVEALLGAPQLMEIASPHGCPVETLVRRSRPSAGRVNQLVAQYPESWEVATDRLEVAQRVWSRLETASLSDLGWLLVDRPPLRILENLLDANEVSQLLSAVRLDAFGRRDRGAVEGGGAADALRRRVADALGVEVSYLEPLRAVHYGRPDQGFEQHVDWIADASDPQLEQFGQRVASALVFLSELPEGAGGETDFPVLGVTVTPKKGTALLWPNVACDGRPLPEL
ncbi:unnamed protein product, partial [Cladocopium goreaui]